MIYKTLQATPESVGRAGYDGAKRRKGSKVHLAVDTLGHLFALCVTPADEQDRAQVSELAKRVQNASDAAQEHGVKLEVAPLPTAKRGFVLLPCRWVVETLARLHILAFAILMLKNVAEALA